MESFAIVVLSLGIIIGINFLVCLLVWSEYFDQEQRFMKFVAISQTFALLWHCVSPALVYIGETALILGLSVSTFFLSTYFMLAAVAEQHFQNEKLLYRFSAIAALLHLMSGFSSPAILNAFWLLDTVILFATPVVTLACFIPASKKQISLFQGLIAILFLGCGIFFNLGYPSVGSLLYVMVALFQPILAVLFIIASIRLSRRNIMERERDFRAFFEAINEVFFRVDSSGSICEVSPSISQFGYTPDQVAGRKLASFLPGSEEFVRKLNPIFAGKKPIEFKGAFLTPDGPADCEIVCSCIRNPETDSFYVAGSISNTQERNLLERQFIEAQRHESLGMLAGGMAHDFNNLLQGIIGYTEILLEGKNLDEETRSKGLNAIIKASTTAGGLCKQLLQYTGKGVRPQDTFDLAEEIQEVVDILAPSCPPDVAVRIVLPESMAAMQGDRNQVGQIFLNLVRNAMDAVGRNGEVSVTLEERYLDEDVLCYNRSPVPLKPASYHVCEVSDTGEGIDPVLRDRIFEPFFSTKKGGHGLGLSAVTGILKIHQGGISVHANPGKGTTFKVYLPVHRQVEKSPEPVVSTFKPPNILVLLVEDDPTVREVASRMLEQAGYKVLIATDGVDALRVLGLSADSVDVVVTDIKMPNMDGIELALKLKEQMSHLPIVLISGYADVSDALERAHSLNFQFVSKPFRGDELATAVARAVEHLVPGEAKNTAAV